MLPEEELPPGIGAGVDAAEPPLPLPPAAGGVVSPVAHSSYASAVGLILLNKLAANGCRKHATAILSCGFAVRLKQLVPEVQLTVEENASRMTEPGVWCLPVPPDEVLEVGVELPPAPVV